ncbi:MAG TPA: nucleoside deaminase [Marinagarivorans sp.]
MSVDATALLESLQEKAITLAKTNPKHPYGTVIAYADGNVLAFAVNDAADSPLRHGEMLALENLFKDTLSDVELSQCTLVTTAEPCPMCAGAIFWSGIGRVVYGTSIATLQSLGVKQLALSASEVLGKCSKPPELIGGVLEAKCNALFEQAAKQQR